MTRRICFRKSAMPCRCPATLRRAVLRREFDDYVSHRPVPEGRIDDAGKADLGLRVDAAKKLTDKSTGVYGICLRGKAGWGENMALLTAMSNSYGAALVR